MKTLFTSLAQKCICIDSLLNTLIDSNQSNLLFFFDTLKVSNFKNLNTIFFLYNSYFKENIAFEDIKYIDTDTNSNNLFYDLFILNRDSLATVDKLRNSSTYLFHTKAIELLAQNYYNSIYLIKYLNLTLNYNHNYNNYLTTSRNSIFSIKTYKNLQKREKFLDLLRDISINAINLFFDYSLKNNDIIDENCEIFYENNHDNRFYQYFFKTKDKSFKIRIYDKNSMVFYAYQSLNYPIYLSDTLSQDNAQITVDNFLKDKLQEEYDLLFFDDSFLSIIYYLDSAESYKYKYNIKDENGKIDLGKGLYITIDAKSLAIYEIYLF